MELSLKSPEIQQNAAREVFKEHLVLVYRILRRLASAQATSEVLQILANDLEEFANEPIYNRYSKAFVLKILYEELMQDTFPYRPDEKLRDISKDDHYLLVLRDAYQISVSDLASIFDTSEGSIYIRLASIRRKNFSNSTSTLSTTLPAQSLDEAGEKIEAENRDISKIQDGETSDIIQNRILSVRHFKSAPEPITPAGLVDSFIPVVDTQKKNRFHINLETAPWYYKTLLEALLATTVVVCIILSLPLVKKTYEFWVERRLDLYNLADSTAFTDQESKNSAVIEKISENKSQVPATAEDTGSSKLAQISTDPVGAAKSSDSGAVSPPADSKIVYENEFGGRANEKPSADKIYRIMINTDAPDLIRKQVRTVLSSVKTIKSSKEGAEMELPGGIMFDVYVPLEQFNGVIKNLSTMGQVKIITTRPRQEKVIKGTAHFKIWLQKI